MAFQPFMFSCSLRFSSARRGLVNSQPSTPPMTFDEDRSRIRRDNAPANMALMRKLVLNAVRMSGSKTSVNRQMYRALFDLGYRRELLARLG